MKIIIDENYKEYPHLVILSEIVDSLFEINLKKYKVLFVFIDNLNLFYRTHTLFSDNCVFIIDKNVYFDDCDNIELKKYTFNEEYDFKDKIIKYNFLRDYLK